MKRAQITDRIAFVFTTAFAIALNASLVYLAIALA